MLCQARGLLVIIALFASAVSGRGTDAPAYDTFQLETAYGAEAALSHDADALRIDIKKTTADLRSVQVYQIRPGLGAGSYRLVLAIRSDKPRSIGVLAAEQRKPAKPLTTVTTGDIDSQWTRFTLRFQIEKTVGEVRAPIIELGGTPGTIWIRSCTIQSDASQ